jgi:uncharacterized NAD(P)/FAD-binding protein YdhS
MQNLLAQGLARPDPLFLGIDVDAKGALIHSNDIPSTFLYTIGPARKGSLWETIAVPEIRTQVAQLAEHLTLTLGQQAEANLAAGAIAQDLIGHLSH